MENYFFNTDHNYVYVNCISITTSFIQMVGKFDGTVHNNREDATRTALS